MGGRGMANPKPDFSVDSAVRVYPETDRESRGVIVEDFGDIAGVEVRVGNRHIVGPAKRWAVCLESGELVFVDSDQLVAG